MAYISVRNWRKFQHYDPTTRIPPWIKNNTDLMANDSYLELAPGQRAALHGIWLEYASARCELRADTASLTRRLNMRVTTATLDALNHAGFIDIVASKALADGYQDARRSRAREETETEKEEENPPTPLSQNGKPRRTTKLEKSLAALVRNTRHEYTPESLREELAGRGADPDMIERILAA